MSGKQFPLSQEDHEILDFSESRVSCPEFARQTGSEAEVAPTDLRVSAPSRLLDFHTQRLALMFELQRKLQNDKS